MIRINGKEGIIELDGTYTNLLKEYLLIKNILKRYADEQGLDFEATIKSSEEKSRKVIDEAVELFFNYKEEQERKF